MAVPEKPFAYSLVVYESARQQDLATVMRTLTYVVAWASKVNHLQPRAVSITAWLSDGNSRSVSRDLYSKNSEQPPSREEAISEIENFRLYLEKEVERARDIEFKRIPQWYVLGAPLEDKIAAYIEAHTTEIRVWLPTEEIEANVKAQGWA